MQKITLALVDDEPEFLALTEIFLKRFNANYELKTWTSGKEFLEFIKLHQDEIDVVISDFEMPELNGLDLLLEIKERKFSMPFIMMSGKAREEIIIEALNRGVDYYVQKSTTAETMFRELNNLIENAYDKLSVVNELEEIKSLYESLVNLSPDGILIHSNLVIQYVNPALVNMLKYNSDNELIGKNILKLVQESTREKIQNRMKIVLTGALTPFIFAQLVKSDGSSLDIEGTGRIINYKGKRSIIVYIRDLTQKSDP